MTHSDRKLARQPGSPIFSWTARIAPTFLQLLARGAAIILLLFFVLTPACVHAAGPQAALQIAPRVDSLLLAAWSWPSWQQWQRVLSLRDYNTRVVLLGALVLGISCGVVGTWMLLRRRSLLGDVVSHASLPGIAVAFMVLELRHPGQGKWLPGLLLGALLAGLLGMLAVVAIRRLTRVKEDAALAIVLSTFMGLGVALFTVLQKIPSGTAAGLGHFIFGKAASLVVDDVQLLSLATLVVLAVAVLLFKEFALVAFDEQFAAAQGWPVVGLDLLLMLLVVGVTVLGLQSVGLLLVVAMLITPAAAARFWTDRLAPLTAIAALLGGLAAAQGVLLSALFPRLSAGAVIVLCATLGFVVSLLCGARRGLVWRWLRHQQLQARIRHLDLLRDLFECLESQAVASGHALPGALCEQTVPPEIVSARRNWLPSRLRRSLRTARRQGLVESAGERNVRLTARGANAAWRIARNHRLWELYLIHFADVAPNHVDRAADEVEHVLAPELVVELESQLARQYPHLQMPPSPHRLAAAVGSREGSSPQLGSSGSTKASPNASPGGIAG